MTACPEITGYYRRLHFPWIHSRVSEWKHKDSKNGALPLAGVVAFCANCVPLKVTTRHVVRNLEFKPSPSRDKSRMDGVLRRDKQETGCRLYMVEKGVRCFPLLHIIEHQRDRRGQWGRAVHAFTIN